VTGSGKTTIAARIAELTALPWHSVDDLTWEPGWIEVPLEEQRRRIGEICSGSRWILDAAYGTWLDIPLARVEVIVALDYPRSVSLWRLLRRTVQRAAGRRPVCNGNVETWRTAFSRDSIVIWHFRSFPRKRARIRHWTTSPLGPQVVRLTSPAATERWLAGLRAEADPSGPEKGPS
jgi:adenylate kinase family enzyme